MHLSQLASALRDDDLAAIHAPASDDLPAEQILVTMDSQAYEDPMVMQIIRTDADDGTLQGVMMLQFFVELPIDADELRHDAVIQALPTINTLVPLIGFNLIPGADSVCFRHLAALPEGEAAVRVVQELVWMVFYVVETWGPAMIGVAEGTTELADLLD